MKITFQIMSDVHELVDYKLACPCITNRDLGDQSAMAVSRQDAVCWEPGVPHKLCRYVEERRSRGIQLVSASKTAAPNITGDSHVCAISRV